jgi:nucleotide-binding universal stress UspA family protein
MSKRMPVTRSLQIVDRVLSFLILAMGLIMVYLTLTSGSVMLALASLIFLTIGFVKIRDLIPVAFRTIRKTGVAGPLSYKQILLPVSRPEAGESMVKMASDVLSPGGKLTFINVIVVPPQLPAEAEVKKDSARALLKEATGFADKMGIESRAEIVSARTATEAILDRAREYKCDLIIMGSSQRTATEKMLFGNIADVVLQQSPCDVMVLSYTNNQHPVKYVKILVPTAGYRHSRRALDVAVDIVKREGGAITSLYVGPEADAIKGNEILEEARLRAGKSGVKSDIKFTTGNVADTIIDMAKKDDYALIIIGATEHPKYYTALLGNIADIVVKRAPCDVLVIRTK